MLYYYIYSFLDGYTCTKCLQRYNHKPSLKRHEKVCLKQTEKITCELCGKYFTSRLDNMRRHRLVCLKRLTDDIFNGEDSSSDSSWVTDAVAGDGKDNANIPVVSPANVRVPPLPMPHCQRRDRNRNVRLSRNFPCDICGRSHGNRDELRSHREVHFAVMSHLPSTMSNDFATLTLSKHAFGGHACSYDLVANEPCSDVMQFFQMSSGLVRDLFRTLSPTYLIQGRMIARARFFRVNDAGERTEEVFIHFGSPPMSFVGDGEEWFTLHSTGIIGHMETVLRNSSNLEFDSIERVDVTLILRENVDGQGVFTLPPLLGKKRQTIVNVDTTSECFKYAMLSVLHYNDVSNQQRCNPNSYREWEGGARLRRP